MILFIDPYSFIDYYDAKREQVSQYVSKMSSSVQQLIRQGVSWAESLKIGERNILVALRQAILVSDLFYLSKSSGHNLNLIFNCI